MSHLEKSENTFSYADIADAPETHRLAARMLVAGCSVEDTAAQVGVHEIQVERMLRHVPFLSHVQSLSGRAAIETAKQHLALSELFTDTIDAVGKAVKKLATRLDAPDCDTVETAMILEKIHGVGKETADRLPGRAFTKVSRNELKTVGLLQVERPEQPKSPRGAIVDRFAAIEAEAQESKHLTQGASEADGAHNPVTVGSTPTPATKPGREMLL